MTCTYEPTFCRKPVIDLDFRYDNYLDKKRHSGTGALGMGFLNGSMDDDDDDDDEDYRKPVPAAESRQAGPLPSKHAALAAATASVGNRKGSPSPPPQYIASPRPGYVAPIGTLNKMSRPEPAAAPARQQQPLQINVNPNPPQGHNPFVLPHNAISSSSVPSTPHPLQPPMTPITPVFIRPAKGVDIKFRDEKPIMRGNSEGVTLPKRGERGDDFWRRFSVIAKDENRKSSRYASLRCLFLSIHATCCSSWLKKTQNGTTRLSRWVWIIGMLLAIVRPVLGYGFVHINDGVFDSVQQQLSVLVCGYRITAHRTSNLSLSEGLLTMLPLKPLRTRAPLERAPRVLPPVYTSHQRTP